MVVPEAAVVLLATLLDPVAVAVEGGLCVDVRGREKGVCVSERERERRKIDCEKHGGQ